MAKHDAEDAADLTIVPDETILKWKVELAIDVNSIQTELGDRHKCHLNGTTMTVVEWNAWRQRSKRALKYKLATLMRVKLEIKRRQAPKKSETPALTTAVTKA